MPGIPPIAPYPLPIHERLPDATLNWRLASHRSALLIHDMQHYFLRPFSADQPPLADVTANLTTLLDAYRRLDLPIVYTVQPGGADPSQRGLLTDLWGPGMPDHDRQRAIPDTLAPQSGDIVLTKHRYSAFHGTDLLEQLRARNRDQLVLCGVYAHIGILATATDAFSHGIQPFLISDGTADFSLDWHTRALHHAAACCATVIPTTRALAQLEHG